MTDRYAVIGHPISHSKSPLIHRHFAAQTAQDLRYEALLAPLDGFVATVQQFVAEGGRGMNVTVPFKLEAFALATTLSERAQAARAVNTLSFLPNGDILGDNTDGAGLVRDIQHNQAFPLAERRVLLLGAGGAASGVMLPLLQAGVRLCIANRTASKAVELASRHASVTGCGYADLAGQAAFDCVINATSSGLNDELPPIPATVFAPGALGYDMLYGRETPFMAFARAQGAQVADGLGMLLEQAAESFYVWRGVRPDTAPVREALQTK